MELILSPLYKPWLCAHSDEDRPLLCHVLFEPVTDEKELPTGWTVDENRTPGFAVATDGVVMCVVPCIFQHAGEPPPTEGWLVDAKFLATVSRQKPTKYADISLQRTADGKGVESQTKTGLLRSLFPEEGMRFPKWRSLAQKILCSGLIKEPTQFVCFSPKKLQALMDALGIQPPDAPTLALCDYQYGGCSVLADNSDAFGLIAPVRGLGMNEYERIRRRFISDDETEDSDGES